MLWTRCPLSSSSRPSATRVRRFMEGPDSAGLSMDIVRRGSEFWDLGIDRERRVESLHKVSS